LKNLKSDNVSWHSCIVAHTKNIGNELHPECKRRELAQHRAENNENEVLAGGKRSSCVRTL